MITVEHLTKRYGEVTAVDDLSFEIQKGNVYGFLGPNGAGKSTTMNVTIYWIVQADEEDDVIENLLDKYESLSEHIEVVKKNPDIYPTFAEQYTDETVQNNSLVVKCGERSRFIGYDDIYLYDADMSGYSYNVSFDGEGAVTSAIDYVVNEDQPKIYMLEGHGEAELSEPFREQLEKENIELTSFSLLTADAVPEDADGILIYGPSSDISTEEKNLLAEYVSGGGKLMVLAGPTEDGTLTNLYGILEDYGVETADGIVVDTDRGHYAFQAPYVLLPDLAGSEITDPLIEENYYMIMPVAQGLTVQDGESVGSVGVAVESGEVVGENGEDAEEVTAYARVGESKIIYRLTTEQYKELKEMTYDSLRHQELFWADFSDMNRLDIQLEDTGYTITSEQDGEDRVWYYQDEELDITELQDAIRGLRAGSFTDQAPDQKEEIGLTIYLDNEAFPKVHIQLYRYDGEDCIAVVDGKTEAFVARSRAVDLIEAVNSIVLK